MWSYQLELDWIDRTTDPNDPEVKRARAKAQREGRKPPRQPIIPPIAHRPERLQQQAIDAYMAQLANHGAGPSAEAEFLSSDEFDRQMQAAGWM